MIELLLPRLRNKQCRYQHSIWSLRGTTHSSAQCKLIRNQLLCTIFEVSKMQLCIVNAGTKCHDKLDFHSVHFLLRRVDFVCTIYIISQLNLRKVQLNQLTSSGWF